MKILIIDSGIYPINSSFYNEPFHLYGLLKDRYEVEVFKDRLFDKINEAQTISFDEMFHNKYDIIISLNPLDFEYILKYTKKTKYEPIVIFIDRFGFIKDVYNGKRNRLTKLFNKVLKYIDFYFTTRQKEVKMIDRSLEGLEKGYIAPFVDYTNFAESVENDDKDLPILFADEIDSRYTDLKTFIKAIKYIAKSDFAERNNFLIEVSANGVDFEKFRKTIRKANIEEYFVFTTPQNFENNASFIRNHRFSVIMPKKYPYLDLELSSLANGVPTLIDSKFVEFTEDTKNGIVFESGNYVDLAEKIMLMLSSDLTEMKRNAVRSARSFNGKYNLQIMDLVHNAVDKLKERKYNEEINSRL